MRSKMAKSGKKHKHKGFRFSVSNPYKIIATFFVTLSFRHEPHISFYSCVSSSWFWRMSSPVIYGYDYAPSKRGQVETGKERYL